jgi:hypothetical protein
MTDIQIQAPAFDDLAVHPGCLGAGSAIATTTLPRAVIETLHQRGVTSGSVLLLAADGAPERSGCEPVPQFQVVRTTASQASRVRDVDFAAAIVIVERGRIEELESAAAAVATRLSPDAPLVLVLREARPERVDRREEMHLMLLRRGFDRVWVHHHRRDFLASARLAPRPTMPRTCSIIVPVFNEKETFPELMRALLAKRLEHLGLGTEIILVESNSTDGSRELVAGFAGLSGVRILWQDRPRGKGYAVREGLRVARGDIILIQDADLEYDVNDYDALLEPLLRDRAAFVLGSRYRRGAKMRSLAGQPLLSAALNCGHRFFTLLLNALYGQNMKDPLTMFKVFRRDCLHGLEFQCDRFDFDHELVIKLLLKGYRPLEVPVSYQSRSFKQGKKIRLFRDPLGWVLVDLKYRLRRLRPRVE